MCVKSEINVRLLFPTNAKGEPLLKNKTMCEMIFKGLKIFSKTGIRSEVIERQTYAVLFFVFLMLNVTKRTQG